MAEKFIGWNILIFLKRWVKRGSYGVNENKQEKYTKSFLITWDRIFVKNLNLLFIF